MNLLSENQNAEIREMIAAKGVKHWQLAYALGVSTSTLSLWLRTPLTDERRSRIEAVLNEHE